MSNGLLRISALILALATLSVSPAMAQDGVEYDATVHGNRLEIGAYFGALLPYTYHELYNPQLAVHKPMQRVGFDVGFRLGYMILPFLGAEFEAGVSPVGTRKTDTLDSQKALFWTLRGHALLQVPLKRVAPFLTVGGGGIGVNSEPEALAQDLDAAFDVGLGLKIFPHPNVTLRFEGRAILTAHADIVKRPGTHFEVLAGVAFGLPFDYSAGPKDRDNDTVVDPDDRCPDDAGAPAYAGCPDRDEDGIPDPDDLCLNIKGVAPDGCPPDTDGDGLRDDKDQCPEQPEDIDNFEDANGCPDPDNDQDGFLDLDDLCPMVPGEAPDGCPLDRDSDTDGDGIKDFQDQCPNDVEDIDEFKDDDGCPDPDNDEDGIADELDQCPNEAEVYNAVDDEDGCPDEALAAIEEDDSGVARIIILDKVYFDVNKTSIKSVSFPVLDAVQGILTAYPSITKVEIQGHTDSDGSETANMNLSQGRAEAVVTYLVDKGIGAERLLAKGFGESTPVVPNTSAENKALNRRVEFIILEQEGTE